MMAVAADDLDGLSARAAAWQRYPKPACEVCGSTRRRRLGRRLVKSAVVSAHGTEVDCVVQCRDCALIYADPLPVPGPELLQALYGTSYFDEEDGAAKSACYEHLLQLVASQALSLGRWLDVGCGEGALLERVAADGWEPLGVDLSATFVQRARQRLGDVVLQGELSALSLPPGSCDVISLYAVLEHVVSPWTLLSEARRLLKPSGLLYLKVPNDAGLVFIVGDLYYRLRGMDLTTHLAPTVPPFHLYGFTQRTITAVAARLGLTLLRIRAFNDGRAGFQHAGTLCDQLETWGYAACHHLGGALGMGLSLEALLRAPQSS